MKRTAQAVWSGALKDGKGAISLQSGALKDSPYSFKARFEDDSAKSATNPEELIAAAHASCFAMQLSHFLAEAGRWWRSGDFEVRSDVARQCAGHERGAVHRAGKQGQGWVPRIEGAGSGRDHTGCEAGGVNLKRPK